MVFKKQKKKQDKETTSVSKEEKEMFAMRSRAHDARGNPVDWSFLKSLWGY